MRTKPIRTLTSLLAFVLLAGVAAAQADPNATEPLPPDATSSPPASDAPAPDAPASGMPANDTPDNATPDAPASDASANDTSPDENATASDAPQFMLYGYVTADGSPVEGARVDASNENDGATATTGPDGAYEMSLPAGTYEIEVTAPEGYADAHQHDVALSADTQIDIALGTNARLSGVVSDEHGAPVPDAQLTFCDDQGNGATATTDAEGRYSVDLPAGDYQAVVDAPGYGSRTIEDIHVEAGSPATFDVTLDNAGHSASGTASLDGKPAEGVLVMAIHRDASGNVDDITSVLTDAKGEWSMAPLADGDYALVGVEDEHAAAASFTIAGADAHAPDLALHLGGVA